MRSGLGKADGDKNPCTSTDETVREKHVAADLVVCAHSDMGR
jgi:hypothetical protein